MKQQLKQNCYIQRTNIIAANPEKKCSGHFIMNLEFSYCFENKLSTKIAPKDRI